MKRVAGRGRAEGPLHDEGLVPEPAERTAEHGVEALRRLHGRRRRRGHVQEPEAAGGAGALLRGACSRNPSVF